MADFFRKVVKRVELPREDDTVTHEQLYLANKDLLPVPVENRIWGKWTYLFFWFAEGSSITSLTAVGTAVKNGLSWWEAWLACILSHLILVCFIVCTGRGGSMYHVPFPVIARASFGTWGSYWPLISRNIMTVIWSGVQGVSTGNCIYLLLHALTPKIAKVHNPFSKDVTMTGGRLIGFSIGWFITLMCCFVPPHKFSRLVAPKSIIMSIFILVFFAWTIAKGGGIGNTIYRSTVVPKAMSHGWLFWSQTMVQTASNMTFAANNSDLTRYARRPNDALWMQVIGYPIGTGIVAFFGVFIISASQAIYGKVQWDPIAILDGFLLMDYSPATRAGVFFVALGFSFSQVTTMIFANLISAGNDTSALVPKYISVRRGAIIAMILSFAITPWNLSKTSFAFTNYLGSYDVFLAGFVGVIIVDYFWVRRGFLDIHQLFSGKADGLYYYTHGFNWRAFAAYFLGMVPFLPGFAAVCGAKHIPDAAKKIFAQSAIFCILLSGGLYALFCWISPPVGGLQKVWNEVEPGNDFIPRVDYLDGEEGIYDEEKDTAVVESKSAN